MTLRCHRVFYVCGCVHVTSFPLRPLPIPWTQWERVEWRTVCESVYVFGTKMQGYGGSFFLAVQKVSKQPQQWLQFINTFMYTIVLFSVVGERKRSSVYRPLMTLRHYYSRLSFI